MDKDKIISAIKELGLDGSISNDKLIVKVPRWIWDTSEETRRQEQAKIDGEGFNAFNRVESPIIREVQKILSDNGLIKSWFFKDTSIDGVTYKWILEDNKGWVESEITGNYKVEENMVIKEEAETVTPIIESGEKLNKIQILQEAIKMEMDTVASYKNFVNMFEDTSFQKIFEDAIAEEQKHIGQFQAELDRLSPTQATNIEAGKEEATGIALPKVEEKIITSQSGRPIKWDREEKKLEECEGAADGGIDASGATQVSDIGTFAKDVTVLGKKKKVEEAFYEGDGEYYLIGKSSRGDDLILQVHSPRLKNEPNEEVWTFLRISEGREKTNGTKFTLDQLKEKYKYYKENPYTKGTFVRDMKGIKFNQLHLVENLEIDILNESLKYNLNETNDNKSFDEYSEDPIDVCFVAKE